MNYSKYENDAKLLLTYQWSRTYESLLECEDDPSCWYVDDRSEPTLFKNLLSWSNPELAMKLYGTRVNRTDQGLKHMLKRETKTLLEELNSNEAFRIRVLGY